MAFSALVNSWTSWYLANRYGTAPGGSPGTCLVSDLLANDYCVGARLKIVSTGATTSGNRTLTVQRADDPSFTVVWPAASSIVIIRP